MRKMLIFALALNVCFTALAQENSSKREEIENAFIAKMKAMPDSVAFSACYTDTAAIMVANEKGYYVIEGETYILDKISSTTYYADNGPSPSMLCDRRFPRETISNRLLSSCPELPSGSMKVRVNKYRYAKDSLEIRFDQFVEFCWLEEYNIYVGIEKEDGASMTVDVFLYNPLNEWLHIFVFNCPVSKVADEGLVIDGDAWLFIPTSNLRNIMGKELPSDFMEKIMSKTKK